jgi:hypothetical protein
MVQLAKVAAPAASVPQEVPAAQKLAGKKGKKKGRLDRLNTRLLYAQGLTKKLADDLRGQVERLDDASKAKKLLVELVVHLDASVERQASAGKNLFQLGEVKWEPSNGARLFRAGDAVVIKARHVERFTKHGAYTTAELKGLKVVSVHGQAAKIQTAKGEALGLVALSWLSASDK